MNPALHTPKILCENCHQREAEYLDEYCGYDQLCEPCQDEEMESHEAGRPASERAELKEARRIHP